jgi:hypothetical protein
MKQKNLNFETGNLLLLIVKKKEKKLRKMMKKNCRSGKKCGREGKTLILHVSFFLDFLRFFPKLYRLL